MNIRKAEIRDIPRIGKLLEQVNALHHEGRPDLFGSGRKYSDDELSGILGDDMRPVLVAVDDSDNALGYAFCVVKDNHDNHALNDIRTLYIDDLCVDAASRGSGVGSALCRAAVGMARDMGCHNVTLNVWTCNPGAMTFYERCGFAPQKIGMEIVIDGRSGHTGGSDA